MEVYLDIRSVDCKAPGCGQDFRQADDPRTHERRHTGERPYNPDTYGKAFPRSGDVRAHKLVHQYIKPLSCKLDSPSKQLAELGNSKQHQNKFWADALLYFLI